MTVGPTPAGAGSTRCDRHDQIGSRAYPRWRGEHWVCLYEDNGQLGLPPLARGAPRRVSVADRVPGPTPAGAGSTNHRGLPRLMWWAYPRWRGEHSRMGSG